MPRIRTIKPEFFKNDELAELSPLHRLLFQGLWCLADREGRLEDRPKRIKVEILPYDDADVGAMLSDLTAKQLASLCDNLIPAAAEAKRAPIIEVDALTLPPEADTGDWDAAFPDEVSA